MVNEGELKLQVKFHDSWDWDGTTGLKIMHLGADERSKHEAESELSRVKEQLRNAKDHMAYLVDRVST
jgi:hypothetical protein